jgi:hypothetical protein
MAPQLSISLETALELPIGDPHLFVDFVEVFACMSPFMWR